MPPASPPNPELRRKVIALYKEMLHLGKEYPNGGLAYVRPRLHRAFMANAGLRDEEEVAKKIAHAEYVKKGK
ncbi:hypothetical protein SLS62_003735 [Diatrype stigma]|uniref:Complex 1 LYR protein domain-containing protein n=1 Tax=Diatrype stigma TaxID=117547 RepID=A0AAN9YPM6_9PEZI